MFVGCKMKIYRLLWGGWAEYFVSYLYSFIKKEKSDDDPHRIRRRREPLWCALVQPKWRSMKWPPAPSPRPNSSAFCLSRESFTKHKRLKCLEIKLKRIKSNQGTTSCVTLPFQKSATLDFFLLLWSFLAPPRPLLFFWPPFFLRPLSSSSFVFSSSVPLVLFRFFPAPLLVLRFSSVVFISNPLLLSRDLFANGSVLPLSPPLKSFS